jgi:hypothetical protein
MPGALRTAALLCLLTAGPSPRAQAAANPPQRLTSVKLDVRDFKVAEGPNEPAKVYYEVVEESGARMLRGAYRPGLETVAMGVPIPEPLRQKVRQVRWRWRVRAFPTGGDECRPKFGDSAASVLVTWKRGMRWYMLKYVWSPMSPLGAVCDRKRTLLLFRDTIILERAGPTMRWFPELVDVRSAFINHFARGDPDAEVPDLVGIGVMTDGDQTNTESGADWMDFEILY